MIRETCSCGASIETDGPKADARVAEWRKGHMLHSLPTYIPTTTIYPENPWKYPAFTYTTTSTRLPGETICDAEAVAN